ncbi:MAG: glycosyl hydrolase family 18 protein [Halanaerobiaceae bacterium]
MNLFSEQNKLISLILVIVLLFPVLAVLMIPLNGTVYAGSNSEIEQEENWVKGILLIIVSYFINNFINRDSEEDRESTRIDDGPIIDENSTSEREVLGFYVNWITSYADSHETLEENSQNIDMLAPFWYTLNSDGSIENRYGGHQYEATSLASEENIKVLPLINNSQTDNMMLVDSEIREKAVDNIVDMINDNNYDGINIDFEYIPPWTRSGYTKFIEELSEKLDDDKILTISVFPKIDVSQEMHEAFDYEALAPHVDRVVIMTYDFHWSTGPAGPIAPIDWVENNIEYALEYIPEDKLIMGVANYGYSWPSEGDEGQDISAKEALSLAKENEVEVNWDDSAKSSYFEYQDQNDSYEIWFEDSKSLEYKLDLVEKYDLKGIGIWRLGNSEPEFWEVISNKL